MKCIYCLQDKPPNKYQKREHVIPQCLGHFTPDNLILYDCVCDECNQYFGDKLELYLGRDSFESLERRKHGIEPKNPLKNKRRVKSKIKDGEWKGLIVEDVKSDNPGEIGIKNSIQAGFYNKFLDGYKYYEPNEIPTAKQLEKEGFDLKKTILLIAHDNELPKLIEKITQQGINLSSKIEPLQTLPPSNKVIVESDVVIDRTILRSLSKISFNYFAYVIGSKIVMKNEFDGIRNFVRYDKGDSREFITVNASPILHDDKKLMKFRAKTTQGHLVNVGWVKGSIVSKVSPFNSNTYRVVLCENYKGIWFPIKSGHHFDLNTKNVTKLLAIDKRLVL